MSAVCKFSAMAFGNSMLWTSVNSDQPFPIWSEALGCHHTCSHEGHETDFPRHHEWPQSSSLWAGQVAALDPPTQEAGSGHSCAWCLMTTGCIIDLLPVAGTRGKKNHDSLENKQLSWRLSVNFAIWIKKELALQSSCSEFYAKTLPDWLNAKECSRRGTEKPEDMRHTENKKETADKNSAVINNNTKDKWLKQSDQRQRSKI